MTNYACGHEADTILMTHSILGMIDYLDWKDTVGFNGDKSLCWACQCKKIDELYGDWVDGRCRKCGKIERYRSKAFVKEEYICLDCHDKEEVRR